MSFFKKAGATASIESRYIEGKARGFRHNPEVHVQLEVLKLQEKEVKTLKKCFKAEWDSYKKLSQNEEKCVKELLFFITEGRQNPKLGTIYNTNADFHTKCGEIRTNQVLQWGNILEEWKLLKKSDLKAINSKLDQANKFLVSRQYYEGNKDHSQAKDFDQKYSATIKDFVKLLHELREKKEATHPQFLLRALQAQAIMYRALLKEAELCEAALRSIGPCPPIKFDGFKLVPRDPYPMSEDEKKKVAQSSSKDPYGSSGSSGNPYGQPVVQQTVVTTSYQQPPPPVVVASQIPQCRALYPFSGSSQQELSFNVGDILNIISASGDWWTAEMHGRQGLIPSNYVQRI